MGAELTLQRASKRLPTLCASTAPVTTACDRFDAIRIALGSTRIQMLQPSQYFTQYAGPPSAAAELRTAAAPCVLEVEEAATGYNLTPGPARPFQTQGAVAGGQPCGSCSWFTVPDEANEDGAEETRAAIVGGMSEATSGFLEQATSSNIWVSMSRESAGFCFSKLSKASFSCAIAFCTCDTKRSSA